MMPVIRKRGFAGGVLLAILASAGTLMLTAPLHGDTIAIPWWSPSVQVNSPIGYDVDHYETVENPCHHDLFAQAADSVSSGSIDFAWGEVFGTFLIQSDQVARGTSAGSTWTWAEGNIWVTATQPVSLSISGNWQYSLPADWMQANIGATVKATDSSEYLFSEGDEAETLPGEPASGTLTIQGDVVLTPGHTWVMDWGLLLIAHQGTQNYLATGNGYVSFFISPEPVPLAFFAPLLLAVPRHRRLRA